MLQPAFTSWPFGYDGHLRASSVLSTPSKSDDDTGLLPEPHSLGFPLRLVSRPLKVEMSQDLRNEFAHLEDGDVLADTRPRASTELHSNH